MSVSPAVAWYWPNAILFNDGALLVAKLDADKIGSSRSGTHYVKFILHTLTYTIFKNGEDFSLTINGHVWTHDLLRQALVAYAGDIFCSDFNYLVANTPLDVDVDVPDLTNMTLAEQMAWIDANVYYFVKDANGEKIKFFRRDAKRLYTLADLQKLTNKKWCKSVGGGGTMIFFGIAIAAIIAIVLYSKLAAKKN